MPEVLVPALDLGPVPPGRGRPVGSAGSISRRDGDRGARAVRANLPQIAAVALETGQGKWTGADPAYVTHLLAHGSVVIGLMDGFVVGFGATRRLGRGPGAVSMLGDLFVRPQMHGSGCGRAMLAWLWPVAGAG